MLLGARAIDSSYSRLSRWYPSSYFFYSLLGDKIRAMAKDFIEKDQRSYKVPYCTVLYNSRPKRRKSEEIVECIIKDTISSSPLYFVILFHLVSSSFSPSFFFLSLRDITNRRDSCVLELPPPYRPGY